MFVYFFLSFYSPNCASLRLTLNSLSQALTSLSHLFSKLSQAHSLKLSPLCLTTTGPTRSSMSPPTKARCHRLTSRPTSLNSQAVDQPQTHVANSSEFDLGFWLG